MDVSVSGTIDQKTYLKNFKGGGLQPPLPPSNPPMNRVLKTPQENLHKSIYISPTEQVSPALI